MLHSPDSSTIWDIPEQPGIVEQQQEQQEAEDRNLRESVKVLMAGYEAINGFIFAPCSIVLQMQMAARSQHIRQSSDIGMQVLFGSALLNVEDMSRDEFHTNIANICRIVCENPGASYPFGIGMFGIDLHTP